MEIPVLYPMGAKTDEKRLEKAWDSSEYVAERKYDGSRYLARIEGGSARFVSRQKSKKTGLPVDKTDNVPHLVEILGDMPSGTVLDGEIITHENCTSNEVTAIMGSLPEKAIARQEEQGWVKYVVFDILFYDGVDFRDQPYHIRRKALVEIVGRLSNFGHFERGNDSDYIFPAPIRYENKKEFYDEIVLGGGEGVIIKNINSPYICDKKPVDTWLKVKKYDTYDVVVMGYTEPTKAYTGKHLETWEFWESPEGTPTTITSMLDPDKWLEKGFVPVTRDYYFRWIGAVEFGQYKDGKLVRIGQTDGLSDEMKKFFTDNKVACLGQVMEVGAMEQIKKTGALRHPRFLRFRNDKSPEQCILGEV